MTSPRSFYSGVFLVSGTLMALQILQSRIFSVTTWYHLAFLVISVAMFGLTLGALDVYRGNEKAQRANYADLMGQAAHKFGLYICVALAAQLLIPIVYGTISGTIVTLPLISLFTVMPYYYAGLIISLALTRAPFPVNTTYGIDLLGAAMGCLFALCAMHTVDAPSAVMICALLALAASLRLTPGGGRLSIERGALAALLIVLVTLNVTASKPLIYPYFVKTLPVPESSLTHDQWNSISRVTVGQEKKNFEPFVWGPSPDFPKDKPASFYVLRMDGDAATPINKFDGNRDSLSYLEYDVTTVAYAMPGIENAAIIGVGGGRDALTAHYFGAKNITALDVNNVQIELLTKVEPYKSYAGLYNLPGLTLINSEARSWFASQNKKFDIIQMSLIDTWAATGAGAFALSENGLYTVEALKTFLSDLSDHGVFTVSRWYDPQISNETQRLLSLAAGALLDIGAANPADHIALFSSAQISTLVLARNPFSQEQIDALRRHAADKKFKTLVMPHEQPQDKVLQAIMAAKSVDDLRTIARHHEFDISPPTDWRPFFFNQVRLTNPAQVFRLVRAGLDGAQTGHARATLNLYIILGFALLMVIFVILRPLRGALKNISPAYAFHGSAWFMLIGLGFMFVEVALLQRMSVYLGHPLFGLSVVLFSIVLSTGIGSLLSGVVPLNTAKKRMTWIIMTAAVILLMIAAIQCGFAAFSEAALPVRALLCVALIAPTGILLGFGFPTGMAMIEAINPHPSAWFWGLNGACGVMASALAVALNIACGLHWTLAAGALCYAALILPARELGRMMARSFKK